MHVFDLINSSRWDEVTKNVYAEALFSTSTTTNHFCLHSSPNNEYLLLSHISVFESFFRLSSTADFQREQCVKFPNSDI